MLELYNFAQSTCSLKVRICLIEKGLDWVDRRLVSKDHDHLSDWYLKLNPNGVVPTLVHDGVPIIESSVIAQYLDDAFPEHALTPPDPVGRARMRAWLAFVDHVPTPAVRYPSFQFGGLRLKFQTMTDEEFAANARKRPLKSSFYERMGRDGFPQEDVDKALGDIRKTAARMDGMLAEHGGPWLLGEQYTLADICVAPLMDRMEDLGLARLWENDHPAVADWLARIQARPAYQQAYYHGCRLSELHPELVPGRAGAKAAAAQEARAAV
ncbi:glutathione S-transferase family protein [Faunimonas sp. B44]|uniref:glutathione S-transferase family protein n=1 Tax=Faunimonas sp. B44 TaxID=3461493 RepID=UPI0040440E09